MATLRFENPGILVRLQKFRNLLSETANYVHHCHFLRFRRMKNLFLASHTYKIKISVGVELRPSCKLFSDDVSPRP